MTMMLLSVVRPSDWPLPARNVAASVLVVALGAGPFASAAFGDLSPADVNRSAQAIYGDFMSPYCPGLLLSDCRSPAAADLRAEVRRDLESGVSEAQIRERMEAKFGEKVRAAPRAQGFGLLAWLAPYAMVLAGSVAVVAWMLAHRRDVVAQPERAPADPARMARLEEERRAAL